MVDDSAFGQSIERWFCMPETSRSAIAKIAGRGDWSAGRPSPRCVKRSAVTFPVIANWRARAAIRQSGWTSVIADQRTLIDHESRKNVTQHFSIVRGHSLQQVALGIRDCLHRRCQ